MSLTQGMLSRVIAAVPRTFVVQWGGLIDDGSELTHMRLVATLSALTPTAGRLRVRNESGPEPVLLFDDAVALDTAVHGDWISLDVLHDGRRLLAMTVAGDGDAAFVQGRIPELAGLVGARLDPPTLHNGVH